MKKNKAQLGKLEFKVVVAPEQLMEVFVLRAICFVDETGLKMGEAIDGNDYQSTHFVAYLNGEPIGSGRARWFNEFVKLERFCVRKEFRSIRVVKGLALFILEHCARKGYSKVFTSAEPKFSRLWQKLLGFKLVNKEPAKFPGRDEHPEELVKYLEPHDAAITEDTSAIVLYRTEGAWDTPHALEGAPNE